MFEIFVVELLRFMDIVDVNNIYISIFMLVNVKFFFFLGIINVGRGGGVNIWMCFFVYIFY